MAEPWQYKPCPFCGAPMDADMNMVAEAEGRWQQIVCGACGARGPEVKRCLPFATALQSWNHRADAPGVLACAPTPVAWVPIHPRNGPLWSMTTDKPNAERLPASYPLRPLVFADGVMASEPPKRPNGVDIALNMMREVKGGQEVKLWTPMCWDLARYVAQLEAHVSGVSLVDGESFSHQTPIPSPMDYEGEG